MYPDALGFENHYSIISRNFLPDSLMSIDLYNSCVRSHVNRDGKQIPGTSFGIRGRIAVPYPWGVATGFSIFIDNTKYALIPFYFNSGKPVLDVDVSFVDIQETRAHNNSPIYVKANKLVQQISEAQSIKIEILFSNREPEYVELPEEVVMEWKEVAQANF